MDDLLSSLLDTEMFNYAQFITSELRASSPYRTGNMQRSISLVSVDNNFIDIVISVDYASYVNEQKKHYHWVQNVLDRCSRCIAGNNVDSSALNAGVSYEVLYGGK